MAEKSFSEAERARAPRPCAAPVRPDCDHARSLLYQRHATFLGRLQIHLAKYRVFSSTTAAGPNHRCPFPWPGVMSNRFFDCLSYTAGSILIRQKMIFENNMLLVIFLDIKADPNVPFRRPSARLHCKGTHQKATTKLLRLMTCWRLSCALPSVQSVRNHMRKYAHILGARMCMS